jgi:putative membrane protein
VFGTFTAVTDAAHSPASRDRAFYLANAVVSALALATIGWILVLREPPDDERALAFMPAVNATLNGISTACIIAGWLAIRRGRQRLHRSLMFGALGASVLFLAGYLVYHWVHGDTPYPGQGALRTTYLAILASHVAGSILALPLVSATFWLASTGRFASHRRMARWTLPIWLYVSLTGVVVFLMLRTATR